MQTCVHDKASSEEWMKRIIPFGRLAQSEDVAKAVPFLASDESRFVGVEELFVDGGFVAALKTASGLDLLTPETRVYFRREPPVN
ncbi:SDR family oxidoreductase [Rhizobium laguerreae]|uniref:SDR family oxidoreductase n=1 Tax=Rhizobium laguerreae TaxID=1076926 RepID=UPI001C9121B6|nr:SDR family oxidoreductase [Rhizobium laguerreae]MBY3465808.1 SDR family oxidoreductase [Rhizobium laguerreae]